MATNKMDRYVNRAYQTLIMSAANTITFAQMRFAIGTFQGVGLLLHRILFYPHNTSLRELGAATDHISCAITLRDDLANLNPTNQAVIAQKSLVGMGAAVEPLKTPWVIDLTSLPGTGLLIPANPLYLAMETTGAVAASAMYVVVYYTFLQLSDREAIELLQTIIPGNV